MKKITVLILLFAIFAASHSVGYCEGQPVESAKQFYAAVEKGNVEAALALVAARHIKKISESKSLEGIGEDLGPVLEVCGAINQKAGTLSFKDLKATIEKETKESTIVRVTFTGDAEIGGKKMSEKGNDLVTFIKENGKWVIDNLQDTTKGK